MKEKLASSEDRAALAWVQKNPPQKNLPPLPCVLFRRGKQRSRRCEAHETVFQAVVDLRPLGAAQRQPWIKWNIWAERPNAPSITGPRRRQSRAPPRQGRVSTTPHRDSRPGERPGRADANEFTPPPDHFLSAGGSEHHSLPVTSQLDSTIESVMLFN